MTKEQKLAVKLAIVIMEKHIDKYVNMSLKDRENHIEVGYGESINILRDMVNKEKMTNADRIRNMTDEELAEWLFDCEPTAEECLEWLQSEAE